MWQWMQQPWSRAVIMKLNGEVNYFYELSDLIYSSWFSYDIKLDMSFTIFVFLPSVIMRGFFGKIFHVICHWPWFDDRRHVDKCMSMRLNAIIHCSSQPAGDESSSFFFSCEHCLYVKIEWQWVGRAAQQRTPHALNFQTSKHTDEIKAMGKKWQIHHIFMST